MSEGIHEMPKKTTDLAIQGHYRTVCGSRRFRGQWLAFARMMFVPLASVPLAPRPRTASAVTDL